MKSFRELIIDLLLPQSNLVSNAKDGLYFLDSLSEVKIGKEAEGEITNEVSFPFKMNYFSILLCCGGSFTYLYNLQPYEVKPGDCLILSPGSIGQFENIQGKVQILAMACGREFYPTEIPSQQWSISEGLFKSPLIHFEKEMFNISVEMFKLSHQLSLMPDISTALLKQQVSILYGLLFTAIDSQDEPPQSRSQSLTSDFMELMNKHFKEERQLDFYAARLGVTPKHLSESIKEFTGQSAAAWIRGRVIIEAKALLISGQYPVWQISQMLGFPNESFFGTYFRKATGTTPARYARDNRI